MWLPLIQHILHIGLCALYVHIYCMYCNNMYTSISMYTYVLQVYYFHLNMYVHTYVYMYVCTYDKHTWTFFSLCALMWSHSLSSSFLRISPGPPLSTSSQMKATTGISLSVCRTDTATSTLSLYLVRYLAASSGVAEGYCSMNSWIYR